MFFRNYWWLLLPISVFLILTFFFPVGVTLGYTFLSERELSLQPYLDFFGDSFYRQITGRTLWIGLVVTVFAILMGYPVAFFLYNLDGKRKNLLLALVVFPLWTNSVVRTYSWMVTLGRHGFVNSALQTLGIIDEPLKLLYTPISVIIGLVHLFLPLMVLSLTSAMENIHPSILEAARSLGASELRTFWTAVVPLTMPGLVMGVATVFTGAITAYVTPQMLGGSGVMMLSTLLYQKAMVTFDWDVSRVIAAVSTALTLLVTFGLGAVARKRGATT